MLFGLSMSFVAVAQDNAANVVRQSNIEMNLSRSLWFNSNNAAGISVAPLNKYSIVGLGYEMVSGDFKMTQDGEKENTVGFSTNGATNIGKTYLWGSFDYKNIVEKDSRFVTNLYDPHRDMPYYVGDTTLSKFKKQVYDLNVKVAFPQLANFLTTGCELQYTTRTGAKQLDPRSVTYYLTVSAKPSFLFEISENHHLGLNVNYEYLYERSTFNRSDTEVDCPVFIMRGLGNYTSDMVSGSVGVGTFFYKGNKIGGGLQYGYNGNGSFSALLDAQYTYKVEDVFQTPTKAESMGSTIQNLWSGKLQLMNDGDSFLNKVTVSYLNRATDGIEYIQELDQSFEVSEWVTLAKYVRSGYSYKEAAVNYEIYRKKGNDYSWRAGFDGQYSDKFDEYYLPASTLKAENLFFNIYGKKNFSLCKKSALLAGLNVGYNANLEGEYNYSGSYADSRVVTEMYANDILYMSSDYVKFGAELCFSTLVGAKTSLFLKAKCQYYSPSDSAFDKRVYTDFTLGITF